LSGFFVARKDQRPLQAIAWVLGHVSVTDIVLIIHAWTLHHFLGGDFALEVRMKSKLMLKVSKTGRPKRTR
jgi:hypothetical protein